MHFTYIESGEIIIDIQDLHDGVAHSADDPINDVHHTVCGHLVTVDDPGTVHCHNLNREEIVDEAIRPSFGSVVFY